jgi:Ca-activated chloride channel family protein
MGGTETAAALEAAYKMSGKTRQRFADWQAEHCPDSRAAVLLITDGEIWGADDLLQRATRSGHRIFTVGVGTAVGEGLVTEVALATGGACEVVAPQEGMGERILAQFHRMRQPGIAPIELRWDETPLWQTPVPGHLFAGDTVTVFAGFAGKDPSQLSFAGGATGSVAAGRADMPDIPRLAAHARIGMLGEADEALALALRHQLLTRRTNLLVVAERKEKAEDLPELQKVPHMMPAGMFEHSGHVSYCLDLAAAGTVSDCAPSVVRRSPSRTADTEVDYCRASLSVGYDDLCDSLDARATPKKIRHSIKPNSLEVSAASEAPESIGLVKVPGASSPGEFVANLNRVLARFLRVAELPSSLDELETYGLPEAIVSSLRDQVGASRDDGAIAIAFLHALCESALSGHFERGLRRLVLTGWKQHCADPALDAWLAQSLGATTESAWNWVALPLEEAVGAAP